MESSASLGQTMEDSVWDNATNWGQQMNGMSVVDNQIPNEL